jgi:hypothetical protein
LTTSNDIFALGRLLGGEVAKTVRIRVEDIPESVIRRPFRCSLLDVSVGAGAVEMTKYLLEFHDVKPTRETLKQAISTGNAELIRLMWQRVPEGDRLHRADLLQVAADFHREAALG